jgi:peptide/histidine transporter 3/4
MSSNFQLQGLQMDLFISGDHQLSPATLNVFDSLAIMILIPVVDRGLYPCLERLGLPLGMLTKIGIGFGFAAASVAVAGVIELERKSMHMLPLGANATATCGGDGGKPLPMSELSIWWQTPQ